MQYPNAQTVFGFVIQVIVWNDTMGIMPFTLHRVVWIRHCEIMEHHSYVHTINCIIDEGKQCDKTIQATLTRWQEINLNANLEQCYTTHCDHWWTYILIIHTWYHYY